MQSSSSNGSAPPWLNIGIKPQAWSNDTIPIDTIDTIVPKPAQPQPQVQHNDVAGVLRRNQACLACRRRKLKCDAVRPHCSTCIRSHKHLLRTNPKDKPVLHCEYDDSPHQETHEMTNSPASMEDDDHSAERSGTKKRKSNTGEGRKKKDSDLELMRKKIEELESQLATKEDTLGSGPSIPVLPAHLSSKQSRQPAAIWTNVPTDAGPTDIQSPTAFLEMLSSAATATAQSTGPKSASNGPRTASSGGSDPQGLRAGMSGTTMMTGATGVYIPPNTDPNSNEATAATPMFMFNHQMNYVPDRQADTAQRRSTDEASSRPSTGHPSGFSPFNPSSGTVSTDPIALTPTGVFNFSPAPSGPADSVFGNRQTKFTHLEGLGRPSENFETSSSFPEGFAQPVKPAGYQQSDVPMGMGMDDGLPQLDEAIQQQLLMDLFWPGWPPGLPEPHIVNDLIEAFYDLVPNLPRLMNKTRLQTRMTLPPTHSNFPHPSLIHSICAIAASWCPPALYERSSMGKSVDEKSGRIISFQLRQASLAKEAVHDGLNTGNRMFDVLRAMMILSRIFIDDTRMLECWAMNGLVARMLLPLGLNVRSAELSLKSVMLTPPADALEREERRAAMWFALYHDTIASAASGWGTSISLDELSVPLPTGAVAFESGALDMAPNPQDIESPDLYTQHPVADPFVMVIKASILVNRVTRFARKWKNRHLRVDDDFEGMKKPEFRELANAIACFQLDIDLISAHMLPHTATICLYEPFADITDPTNDASRRILSAAQGIVGIIQQLAAAIGNNASNFTSIMHSSASVCLVTSARTLLVFYRHALNVRDMEQAHSYRSDVEMIRMALSQFGQKFKIGHHHAQLIEYFLDRATHPTYDKLSAHYPDHPRPGALELKVDSDFGLCVMNALNIKRGFWKLSKGNQNGANSNGVNSNGVSPFGQSPASSTMRPPHRDSTGGSVGPGARIDSESPHLTGGNSTSGYVPTRPVSTPESTGGGSGEDRNLSHIGMLLPYIGSIENASNVMSGFNPSPSSHQSAGEGSNAASGNNVKGVMNGNIGVGVSAGIGAGVGTGPDSRRGSSSDIPKGAPGGASNGQIRALFDKVDIFGSSCQTITELHGHEMGQQREVSATGGGVSNLVPSAAGNGSNTGSTTGNKYSKYPYAYEVQGDGSRNIFGHEQPLSPSVSGPTLLNPNDEVWLPDGLKGRSGVISERYQAPYFYATDWVGVGLAENDAEGRTKN